MDLQTHFFTSQHYPCMQNSITCNKLLMQTYRMINAQNILNIFPCSGFAKQLEITRWVVKYFTSIYSLSALSFAKKWRILLCLEFPVQETLPLFIILIVLWLYWEIIFFLISYHCVSRNITTNTLRGKYSLVPTS